MFIAASSAARYLKTYGIATVSIPLFVWQAWHAKFFAGLTVLTPSMWRLDFFCVSDFITVADRRLPQREHTSAT